MQREAEKLIHTIKTKCSQLISEKTQNCLRCERYDVTTAPNGTVIGVTQPYGTTELKIPYTQEVANAKVGDTVMVFWWGSLSTAKAWCYGNGVNLTGGGKTTGWLWTNTTSTDAFASQTVTFSDPDKCDLYIVQFRPISTQIGGSYSHQYPTAVLYSTAYVTAYGNPDGYAAYRTCGRLGGYGQIRFGPAYYYATYGNSTVSTNNNYLIPNGILGVKL